ncbi:MAG: FkbM family methyltransferase, partial [Pseudomonadota bacterium]
MPVPVFVINRACDGDRLQRFRRAAKRLGIKPQRIAAIDGHRPDPPFAAWADYLADHFWGAPDIKPGALACYLSHMKAWQALIASGETHGLICEDDTELTAPQEEIDAAAAESGAADLVFVNDRLCIDGAVDANPVERALARMTAIAPGADCYLLSRNGAEVMLRRTKETRIVCGVDWALIWASLGEELGELPQPEIRQLLGFGPVSAPVLQACVASRPLSRLRSGVASTIVHDRTIPIEAIRAGDARHAHADHAVLVPFGQALLGFIGRAGRDPVMTTQRDGALWEADAIAALLRRFPEGGMFVDVGAHIGNHSVALGRLADARVVAIEVNPEILRVLEINIGMNGLTGRTELVSDALGAEAGQASLEVRRRKPSDSKLGPALDGEPQPDTDEDGESLPAFDGASPNRRIPVSVLTGDAILEGRSVDAIKIDTSGGELDVLKGLRKTLLSSTPDLLVDHRAHE